MLWTFTTSEWRKPCCLFSPEIPIFTELFVCFLFHFHFVMYYIFPSAIWFRFGGLGKLGRGWARIYTSECYFSRCIRQEALFLTIPKGMSQKYSFLSFANAETRLVSMRRIIQPAHAHTPIEQNQTNARHFPLTRGNAARTVNLLPWLSLITTTMDTSNDSALAIRET